MTAEKIINNLEKLSAKLEAIKYHFQNEENQTSFDTMKSDALALLEEISQLIHEDSESEESNNSSEEHEE